MKPLLLVLLLAGCGPKTPEDAVESTRIDPKSVPVYVYRFQDSTGHLVYVTSGGGIAVVPAPAETKEGK